MSIQLSKLHRCFTNKRLTADIGATIAKTLIFNHINYEYSSFRKRVCTMEEYPRGTYRKTILYPIYNTSLSTVPFGEDVLIDMIKTELNNDMDNIVEDIFLSEKIPNYACIKIVIRIPSGHWEKDYNYSETGREERA